jgi:hypothetical protein
MGWRVAAVGLAFLGLGTLGFADEYTASELRAIGEGRGLYVKYCMGCHGAMAKGTAESRTPAAGPDLTVIVLRDGAFDRLHVGNHILYGDQPWYAPAPAPAQMPSWNRGLRVKNFGNDGKAACDVLKLIRYVEFVQAAEPTR